MIFERVLCVVSIEPGTCFCLTKSARKIMKALGGRGMCPSECLRRAVRGFGADVDASDGGKMVAMAASSRSSHSSVSSVKLDGVTLGAKVRARGEGPDEEKLTPLRLASAAGRDERRRSATGDGKGRWE